jgi:hypothetical protein
MILFFLTALNIMENWFRHGRLARVICVYNFAGSFQFRDKWSRKTLPVLVGEQFHQALGEL